MSEGRLARRPGMRLLFSLLAAGSLAAAVFGFGVGPALASSTSYTCTGNPAIDEPAVDTAINNYDDVTIKGPRACYGNFYAHTINVTIRGQTATQQQAVFYGSGTDLHGTVLTVSGNITVILRNMTITHGDNTSSDGGGIYAHNGATLVLNKSTVTKNITENGGDGGGIELWGATGGLWAYSSRITDNTANNDGGGVLATRGSEVHLTDTTVSGNTANGGVAGGISLDKTGTNPGTLDGTTVTDNTVVGGGKSFGGGIDANANSLTMTDSSISWNEATGTGYGGGIFARAADVSLTGTSVNHNSATYGGGIWNEGQSPTMCFSLTNSTVDFNTASSDGGGIANDSTGGNPLTEITNSNVSQNVAENGNGGGIANIGEGGNTATLSITSSTLSGNQAVNGNGGGIANFILDSGQATVSIDHTHINLNQAEYGGGISNDDTNGTATVSLQVDAFVSRNTASIDGGGVWTASGLTIAPKASVSHNTPDDVS